MLFVKIFDVPNLPLQVVIYGLPCCMNIICISTSRHVHSDKQRQNSIWHNIESYTDATSQSALTRAAAKDPSPIKSLSSDVNVIFPGRV